MHTILSREVAKEFFYKSPFADQLVGMYKELTGVTDFGVSGRRNETGIIVTHTTSPLRLRNGGLSQRYGVILLSNGSTTELLVVDPPRGVVGLKAESDASGFSWVTLNRFNPQSPQRAFEPMIRDYLSLRVGSAFRRQAIDSEDIYIAK